MKKPLFPLYAPADEGAVRPILDVLKEKGFALRELGAARSGSGAVLLFLSTAFAADEGLQERFFAADSAGAAVIPVDLDGAAQPELVASALIARNAIPAQGRTAGEIAARVASAEAFASKGMPKKLSRVLIAAAALLILGAGLWIWRSRAPEAETEAEEADKRAAVLAAAQAKYGLTEEDLAEITEVSIVGEYFGYATDEMLGRGESSQKCYSTWENDGAHWYSSVDGREYRLTRYEDLRFLELMPKLRYLTMTLVEADAEALPDLSGSLRQGNVWINDCRIDSLDFLALSGMERFLFNRSTITDFSPLTSCAALEEVGLDLHEQRLADLSGFSPPALTKLSLGNGYRLEQFDLSGLSGCAKLRELECAGLPLTDLSFLSGARSLESLDLEGMDELRDLSALGELEKLRELSIRSCARIRDFSPVGDCKALKIFRIEGDFRLNDTSFLTSLPELEEIMLHIYSMPNLDFLYAFPEDRTISLAFSGGIGDYSALAHIRHYDYLHVNPSGNKLSAVLPYLQGATVWTLHLHDCDGLDLSQLPEVRERLEIWYSDLRDLTAMPALPIRDLQLNDLPYLTSLNGLENLPAFSQSDSLELRITGCPHLTDWSALEGADINCLTLNHVYSLPALENIDFCTLKLEGVELAEDLHFLDGKPEGWHYFWLSLVDQEKLRDLTPLRRLKGEKLTVGPRFAEQAEELAALGAVREYEIAYPDGSWQPDESAVTLLSLDELETLPQAVLARVETLCLAGDEIVDTARYELTERDGAYVLRDRESGEETALAPEGGLSALPDLSSLTGLRRLELIAQPLENLEGIQTLGALEELSVRSCPQLEDVSAAFTLQGLRTLSLRGCPVGSLQGVQNLTELEELEVRGTAVTDLTPLLSLDGLRAVWISEDMTEAAASLDGQAVGFELIIEGGGT